MEEIKKYEKQFKKEELREEGKEGDSKKAKDAIKALIETSWSGSNEEQYKNIQLMLGLAGNDSDSANKFLKKIDEFTSKLNPEDF